MADVLGKFWFLKVTDDSYVDDDAVFYDGYNYTLYYASGDPLFDGDDAVPSAALLVAVSYDRKGLVYSVDVPCPDTSLPVDAWTDAYLDNVVDAINALDL